MTADNDNTAGRERNDAMPLGERTGDDTQDRVVRIAAVLRRQRPVRADRRRAELC